MQAPVAAITDVQLPITEIAGLPLHPLLVHAVVVLVPLTALGAVVMASSGARSRRYSPAVVFVGAGAAASAFLAMWAGQELRRELPGLQSVHFTYGLYLPWAALLLFGMVSVIALMDRQGGGRRNVVGSVFSWLTVLVGLGATALTIATGHTGSQMVWG